MYAYFFAFIQGGFVSRSLLFFVLFLFSPSMYVYALGYSLLESAVINENIAQLKRLYLKKRPYDKVYIVVEKLAYDQIQVDVGVGRRLNTCGPIDYNDEYGRNAQACNICGNIARDLIYKIHRSDVQGSKTYSIPFVAICMEKNYW